MHDLSSLSKVRNRLEFHIADDPLPTTIPKSYRNTSQVSDFLHPLQSTQNHIFHLTNSQNPITQTTATFHVSQIKDPHSFSNHKFNPISTQHNHWLKQNKIFTKPYSDCTRYIDSLSQHQALIRRGPFDLPLQKLTPDKQTTCEVKKSRLEADKASRQYSLSNNMSRLKSVSYLVNEGPEMSYKSMFRTKKQMILKSLNNLRPFEAENKPRASKSINFFDKSLKNTASNYEVLMRQQRNEKMEDAVLKNSAKKLIAVDFIKQKLEESSMATKNNLQKIQQKFKKQPEIRVN